MKNLFRMKTGLIFLLGLGLGVLITLKLLSPLPQISHESLENPILMIIEKYRNMPTPNMQLLPSSPLPSPVSSPLPLPLVTRLPVAFGRFGQAWPQPQTCLAFHAEGSRAAVHINIGRVVLSVS